MDLSDSHNEPLRGDCIQLVDDFEEPNGRTSKVMRVTSEDRHAHLFEVVDNFNQTRIVKRVDETNWIETFLED